MNNLLTIAIPTFNRAELLEKRLTWLAKEIKGFENQVEIIISDNCSTDNTMEVIKKWEHAFSKATFIVKRQRENIGLNSNCAYCINNAISKYVWTIGDNHKIKDHTLSYVLYTLSKYPDLTLMLLNYSHRNAVTNHIYFERCFDVPKDEMIYDGKLLIENWLEECKNDLSFLTSLVYRTDLAQSAIEQWPSGLNNVDFLTYVTAFCALHGSVNVTKDIYIDYVVGNQNWYQDKKLNFRFIAKDVPEVLIQLVELGYSSRLCLKNLSKHFRGINWKFILGALRRWPFYTVNVLSRSLLLYLKTYLKFSYNQ